jgi:hypothetical protein
MPLPNAELKTYPRAFDLCTKGWSEARRSQFMKWALDHGFDLRHPHVWQAVGVWEAERSTRRVEKLASEMAVAMSELKLMKSKGVLLFAALFLLAVSLAGAVGYAIGVSDRQPLQNQSKK